jgi:2-iminobutanoate/2-iminopropanoate deaminase
MSTFGTLSVDKQRKISYLQYFHMLNAEHFKSPHPARSAFQVAALPLGADIEKEAIALIK